MGRRQPLDPEEVIRRWGSHLRHHDAQAVRHLLVARMSADPLDELRLARHHLEQAIEREEARRRSLADPNAPSEALTPPHGVRLPKGRG